MNQENQNQSFGSFVPQSFQSAPAPQRLMSIGELFSQSWKVYKSRFWTILGIIVIQILARLIVVIGGVFGGFFGIAGLSAALKSPFPDPTTIAVSLSIISIIVLIILSLIYIWGNASLIYAVVNKELTTWAALKRGFKILLPFLWISFLVGVCVMGGIFLLIIPGIIFGVWFAFSNYVLIAENIRGSKALKRSKFLVRGYGWQIFRRLFVFAGLIYVVDFIGNLHDVIGIISGIVYLFLLSPLFIIYSYLIYQNLKSLKEGAQIQTV